MYYLILANSIIHLHIFIFLQGKAEINKIATNYKTRFSKLFKPPFTKASFNVISTNTSRTINSAIIFLDTTIGNDHWRNNVLVVAGEKEERILKVWNVPQ